MTTTSSIPAVLDALVALIDAAVTIQVAYGEPVDKQREVVWIGGVSDWSQEHAEGMGPMRREQYAIDFTLIAQTDAAAADATTVFADVTTRAYSLLAGIETAVRAAPQLGLTGTFNLVSAEMGGGDMTLGHAAANATERFCRIDGRIDVEALL